MAALAGPALALPSDDAPTEHWDNVAEAAALSWRSPATLIDSCSAGPSMAGACMSPSPLGPRGTPTEVARQRVW